MRARTIRKAAFQTIAMLIAFTAGVLVFTPANAATGYKGATAAAYARKYSCNNNLSCRNGAYQSFPNDCTNMVSQAMQAGAYPMTYSGSKVWYSLTKYSFSKSYTTVSGLSAFLKESGKGRVSVVTYSGSQLANNAYTAALPGDLYLYDWGTGDGYSHFAMETLYGAYSNYKDPTHGNKNYNSVNGGSGDHMAQHSPDRDGAPWNWGYWVEPSSKIRSKMRTQVLRIK